MTDFLNFFNDRTDGNPMLGSGLRLSGDITKDMFENDIPETLEGHMYLSIAYVACEIPTTAISFSDVDTNWESISITAKFPRRYEPPTNGAGDDRTLTRGANSTNGYGPIWFPNNANSDDYGTYKTDNIGGCPDVDSRGVFNMIFGGHTDWKQFYVDLLNAYQISGLTQGHVLSYMKWNKVNGVEGEYISKHFGKLAGGAPKIGDDDDLRAILRNGKWTEYRSTFATIVGIIIKMFNELPEDYMILFSQRTIEIVRNANRNAHDEDAFREIPTIVLAYAYCWNKVTNMNLEGLWSGKRAFDDLSFANRESMTNVLNDAKSHIKTWKRGVMPGLGGVPNALKNV
jgi:hypothetical protein